MKHLLLSLVIVGVVLGTAGNAQASLQNLEQLASDQLSRVGDGLVRKWVTGFLDPHAGSSDPTSAAEFAADSAANAAMRALANKSPANIIAGGLFAGARALVKAWLIENGIMLAGGVEEFTYDLVTAALAGGAVGGVPGALAAVVVELASPILENTWNTHVQPHIDQFVEETEHWASDVERNVVYGAYDDADYKEQVEMEKEMGLRE